MHVAYYKEYSSILNREMEFKVYGHAGKPCLAFPAQDGHFFDFENFKMVDSITNQLESGDLQLFCIESIDYASWSSTFPNYEGRILMHEKWFAYICDELMPRFYAIHNHSAHEDYRGKFMTTGVSLGAYHALNILLRFPDKFDTVIALSGIYHANYFFPNYQNETIYLNSPIDYLREMAIDHPYVEKYRECDIIICCGQGEWEAEAISDALEIKSYFDRLQVDVWVDLWGYDVCHDWPWWTTQFPYYIDKALK